METKGNSPTHFSFISPIDPAPIIVLLRQLEGPVWFAIKGIPITSALTSPIIISSFKPNCEQW